jgi:hypothetical protein
VREPGPEPSVSARVAVRSVAPSRPSSSATDSSQAETSGKRAAVPER